jgi:tyrosine-protein phosphatase YwqE
MGLFSKHKKSNTIPTIPLYTDLHSHVLPGIDDGAQNIEESLEMIKSFVDQGFTKIITSPHVHSGRYKNTPETIRKANSELQEALKKKKITIPVEFAAEYFLDNFFLEELKNKNILSFSGNYILIEFSFQMPPIGLERMYKLITDAGFQPVIAHPDRYEYWQGNIKAYTKLKEIGYLLQANVLSAGGFYGHISQKNFELLSNNNLIDFLGSDAHRKSSVELLNKTISLPIVQKALLNGIRNNSL